MAGELVVTAKALWYVGPGRAELRDEKVPAPRPGEVRVRTLHSALSRGTESLISAGRVPPSEYERMRAPEMGGEFPFPVKYGYAAVGIVEAGSPELIGNNVFALYPHQGAFTIAADAVAVLPDDVPPTRAILAANMETALNAVWDAAPGPADHIVIVGAGVVGCLIAWLCGRLPGAEVTLVDIDPRRAKTAAGARRALRLAGRSAGQLRCCLPCERHVVRAGDRARGGRVPKRKWSN